MRTVRVGPARGPGLMALCVLGGMMAGCADPPPAPADLPEEERPGGDPVEVRPGQEGVVPGWEAPVPPELATVLSEPVVGWTGPGGRPFEVALRTPGARRHLARRIGGATFPLALRVRRPDLGQYPCSSCHTPELPPVDPEVRIEDAHGDIRPVHPPDRGAVCTTCHAPDDVETLAVGPEERAGLDHAYRLCAECHSREVSAWAGGAHGKRLDGWSGPRVVMGCSDCHDPHAPELEARIPYAGPRIPGRGGGNR